MIIKALRKQEPVLQLRAKVLQVEQERLNEKTQTVHIVTIQYQG